MTPGHIDRGVGRTVFGADSAGYHAARLAYPDELYAQVLTSDRPPSLRTILEVGAGTGLATARLAAAADRLVAIEPDPMLAEYLRRTLAGHTVEIVQADFVSAEIADTFDLVAAASSFHWLDAGAALPKIRALLKPGGRIALWWNVYRQPGIGDRFADATMDLLKGLDLPPSESMQGHYSLDADLHRRQLQAAGFEDVDHHVYRRERQLSADDAKALYASYSFVRALPEHRRAGLLRAIGDLVDREFDGAARNIVLTSLYLAARSA